MMLREDIKVTKAKVEVKMEGRSEDGEDSEGGRSRNNRQT